MGEVEQQVRGKVGGNSRNLGGSKEKGVPTTGNFQKGLEYKSVSQEESRTFRTCVGILLYVSTERPDTQCATRCLASKVTKPDEGDWRELKQVVLYVKGTKDYAQVMRATGSMSSALTRIFHPEGDDGGVYKCSVMPTGQEIEVQGRATRAHSTFSTAISSTQQREPKSLLL